MKSIFVTALLVLFTPLGVHAKCSDDAKLVSDKPNLLGFTKDSDDKTFMELDVSIKTPLFYGMLTDNGEDCSGKFLPYFGFNYRAGQYIDTRDSSPVITKHLNPYLRGTIFLNGNIDSRRHYKTSSVALEIGHLSNGQSIETADEFTQQVSISQNNEAFARDFISRSYEYLELNYHGYSDIKCVGSIMWHGVLRYYDRLWSNKKESFHEFEDDRDIKHLRRVSGIKVGGIFDYQNDYVGDISLSLETGMPVGNMTYRGSVSLFPIVFDQSGIGLNLWGRKGYNGDLAQYYKKTSSIGIAFSFTTSKSRRPASPEPLKAEVCN